jgi:hypothetical protein
MSPIYLVLLPRGLSRTLGVGAGAAFRYFRMMVEGSGWPRALARAQVRSRVLKDVLVAPVGRIILVCWVLGFVCVQFL